MDTRVRFVRDLSQGDPKVLETLSIASDLSQNDTCTVKVNGELS
jgi:hypothetical protein